MKKFPSLLFAAALLISSSGAVAQTNRLPKSKREIVVITDKEKLSAFLGLSAEQEKIIFKEIDALYPLLPRSIKNANKPNGSDTSIQKRRTASSEKADGTMMKRSSKSQTSANTSMPGSPALTSVSNQEMIKMHVANIQKQLTQEQLKKFEEVVSPVKKR